jgi:hypothetical protein
MRRKKNIKLRVKNLTEKYNTNNPYKLCEKLGVTVMYFNLGEIKGCFQRILKRKYIFINENLDEYSQKVVLCHELGHAIFHNSKNINFMKKSFLNYTSKLENEANEFAAELLSYDNEEISYDLIENSDLGFEVMEEIKRYKK